MNRDLHRQGRATIAAALFVIGAGLGIHGGWPRAAHAGPRLAVHSHTLARAGNTATTFAVRSQETSTAQGRAENLGKASSRPYEADHLDSDFVDRSRAEPLPAESVGRMAVLPHIEPPFARRDALAGH